VIAQYLVSGENGGTGIWLAVAIVMSPLAVGLALRWNDRRDRNRHFAVDAETLDAPDEKRTYGYRGYAIRFFASLLVITLCVFIAGVFGVSSWVGVAAGVAVAAVASELENSHFRGEYPLD